MHSIYIAGCDQCQYISHTFIPASKCEFDIKKEAAWAVSNATFSGSDEQIKYEAFLSLHV
jgi:hypothetical protein